MRPLSGIAFALTLLISPFVNSQTAASQATAPQTARQALIEMFFGQAPDHLEKHLPDVTLRTFQKLGGANGQSGFGALSLLAMQARAGGKKLETFDTGSTLVTAEESVAGTVDKVDITVERDDLLPTRIRSNSLCMSLAVEKKKLFLSSSVSSFP